MLNSSFSRPFVGALRHLDRRAGTARMCELSRRRSWLAIAILLQFSALALVPVPTFAQGRVQGLELQELEGEGLSPGAAEPWNVTLGMGLADAPVYPGASTNRGRLVPLFSVSYDQLVSLSPFGLAVQAIRVDGFFAGPVLSYQGHRDESDDLHLSGLGNIPSSLTAGVFAGYRTGPWELFATARQAITHSGNGLEGLAKLSYRAQLLPHRLTLVIGPEISFGDGEYNRTWFGVSPTQSASSGLPVYAPKGGVDSYGLGASLTSVLSDHWLLHAFANVRRLTSGVTDSPLAERRNEGLIGIGIAYHF